MNCTIGGWEEGVFWYRCRLCINSLMKPSPLSLGLLKAVAFSDTSCCDKGHTDIASSLCSTHQKRWFHFSLSWCFLVGNVLQCICLLFWVFKLAVSVGLRQVMGQVLVTYTVPEQLARVTCVPGGAIWAPNFSLFKLKIFKWREKNVGICLQRSIDGPSIQLNIVVRCWNSSGRATSQPVCQRIILSSNIGVLSCGHSCLQLFFAAKPRLPPCSVLLNLRPSPECQHVGS